MPPPSARRFWLALGAVVLVTGSLYVGLRLSPSSYAIVLEQLGVADTGLIAGTPRPLRGDEFGWQTPLLQMALRSHFQRYDRTPPYFEDLRSLYALPILDWGVVFKPQLWVYFLAPPSFAYSFYHFTMIAMFVVGFTVLFVRLGGGELDSFFMALVLYFAAYTQYWWNGAANFLLPFFPWIVLALLWDLAFPLRLALLSWLSVCGLLTCFYPPHAIPLAFVGVLLCAVARRDLFAWPRLLAVLAAGAAAAGIVALYLRDLLPVLGATTYPGHRISHGGSIGVERWLTQWLPTSQVQDHVSLLSANVCEDSTLGSVYALAVLCFLPWREIVFHGSREERRRWLVLGAGLLATQAWMTLPLPAWVGYPLLWHRVPPGRMVLAGGLLLLVLTFLLGRARPLRVTLTRTLLFGAVLLAAWYATKRPHGIGLAASFRDWVFVGPALALVVAGWIRPLPKHLPNTVLLGSAALLGIVSFGTFNPVQSTKPIFTAHETPVTRKLDRAVRRAGRGFLLLPWGSSFFAHTGLPLVGLGYPSIAYSTFDPALDLWRKVYPDLTPDELQSLFNNAGGFAFGDVKAPLRVPGTLVTLSPRAPFREPGKTVCDFIRPSRSAFAPSVGCPTPAAPGGR